MRFLKEDTAFVLIDVQERLFPHILEHNDLERNINTLVHGFKELELPIIVTEQYVKGLGSTLQSIQKSLGESYKPLEKMSFSCCGDDNFLAAIRGTNKKNILLAGIETHVCVLQTALDLVEMGFNVGLVTDCVSSRKHSDKEFAIERMKQEGVWMMTKESILFELLKLSGTQTFKNISKLVK